MNNEEVTIYISGSCGPCKEVREKHEKGLTNMPGAKLIDVETTEGFPFIESMKLTRVPTAMKGSQQCDIGFADDGSLVVSCAEDEPAQVEDEPNQAEGDSNEAENKTAGAIDSI
jgi:hypothetical protein